MVKLNLEGKAIIHSENFLLNYAKENQKDLIHTKEHDIIVSNFNGWCTVVSNKTRRIYHAWAGELII